jgi:hypothetical protein
MLARIPENRGVGGAREIAGKHLFAHLTVTYLAPRINPSY